MRQKKLAFIIATQVRNLANNRIVLGNIRLLNCIN